MVTLKTTVAGIPLECCIYNASGPRTGASSALLKITESKSGAVLTKSATILKQTGNPQPRTWQSEAASLNSEGLPNSGIDYYIDHNVISESLGQSNKPYMVSISGKTLDDNIEMIQRVIEVNATSGKIACLELNLACPNVIGKPIIAYDFDQMKEVLSRVSSVPSIQSIKLGVKLPPYFDGPHFETAATILNANKNIISYVATINTIGNAMVIDSVAEMPVISSNNGFAGLSGKAVKYTALANVRKMRLLLDPSIDVVGVGGIESGEDAFQHILCGASAVQVGTCHWREGPKCFDRIHDELIELMEQKGYKSIEDFKGKLNDWSKEGFNQSRVARNQPSKSLQKMPEKGNDITIFIHALLLAIIAILVADKYGIISF
jgi:dihydroorotate dehydrogenase (fumarate)